MSAGRKFEERFWPNVDKSGVCWEWTGRRSQYGYGRVCANGESKQAHRLSYELAKGPIPVGLVIDHICHNRGCVNPDHLRAITQKQNIENHSGPTKTSKSGVRGVSWNKNAKKWAGFVQHNKKHSFIGYFTDIAEAEAAVIAKRNELFTHNDADRRAA